MDSELKQLDEQVLESLENRSKFPGMSYEDGIRAVLEYIENDYDEEFHPLSD